MNEINQIVFESLSNRVKLSIANGLGAGAAGLSALGANHLMKSDIPNSVRYPAAVLAGVSGGALTRILAHKAMQKKQSSKK